MIAINVDLGDIDRKLAELARKSEHLHDALDAIGREIVSITQRRIKRGVPPPNAPLTRALKGGSKTLQNTGRLLASITHKVGHNFVAVGTDVKYAPIQQFGGIIRAKHGNLAIPASRDTLGLMRRYGASVSACLDKMKEDGWRIWKSKSGKSILGQKYRNGKPTGKVKILFYLKPSVRIPARPFLRLGFEEKQVIKRILSEFFMKGFNNA